MGPEARRKPDEGEVLPRVLVVTNMYPSPDRPAFGIFVKRQVESLNRIGSTHEVLMIEGWRSRWNYAKAIWRVRQALRSGRFDVVHAYYGLCGFVAAWQRMTPLVVSFCGSDLNPGFAGRDRAPLRSLLVLALGQFAAWRARTSLVRSEEMRSRLALRSTRDGARILKSGVDLDLFKPGDRAEARARLGWPLEPRVVLFVCADPRLPAVKRPELARSVVERVKKELPDAELRIVAGLDPSALPDYYNAADILLLTSATEGSPNVVKEALACNLPVVSTAVGDVPRMLAGAPNCHVTAARIEEMAARIVEVLRSGTRTRTRERMEAYSLERTSAALLEVYRVACARRNMHPALAASADGSLR
jgi:glycosyltransferase involved in cell wall biosynthesis